MKIVSGNVGIVEDVINNNFEPGVSAGKNLPKVNFFVPKRKGDSRQRNGRNSSDAN